jgi:hypothetical protein
VLAVFRDEALKPQLAGVLEDGRTVADEVLAELDAPVMQRRGPCARP